MNNFERKVNGYDRASNLFETMYNPSENNFNLERIREKNIAKINKIIARKDEINGRYRSKLIRDLYSADYSSMTENEKKKFIADEEKKINNEIKLKLLDVDDAIDREIKHQVKMIKILVNKGDTKRAYEFYNLMVTKPLAEPYSKREEELYREFLMENPNIERIIISYSEFEALNPSVMPKTTVADNKSNDIKAAIRALDIAEKSIELEDYINAKNLILDLPDSKEKEALLVRYKKLLIDQTKTFEALLKQLKAEKEENRILDVDLVVELTKRFELLESDKKKVYKDDVKSIVDYNNVCIQDARKEDIANEIETTSNWKYSLGTRIVEFFGMPVNWIRRSNDYLDHINVKRKAALKNNKQKLAEKCNKIYLERDVVSGPIHYANVNKLNSIKPKLYRNSYSLRSNKLQRKYMRTMASVFNKMNKSVSSMYTKEEFDILRNRERAINVINQCMQMIAMYDKDDSESLESDSTFNGLVKDTKDMLLKLKEIGTIGDDIYLAYLEEIDNIISYKQYTPDNRIYEYFDEDIKEISEKKSSLPYVKRK